MATNPDSLLVREKGIGRISKYKDLKIASAKGTSTLNLLPNLWQMWSHTHPTLPHLAPRGAEHLLLLLPPVGSQP